VLFPKKKILKYIFRAVLGLLSLLLIISALLLWRLSSGPIQLNKLTPTIQRVVSNLPGNSSIRIKGIELVWDRQMDDLRLQATQVALLTSDKVNIVTAPVVNISLSIAALAKRVIAFSAIEVKGVKIHLVRNQDGSLQLGKRVSTPSSTQADNPGGFQDLTELLTHTVKVLESPANPQSPLSYLKTIRLQGDLTAKDHKLDMEFGFKEAEFKFEGQDQGIKGDLSLSVDSPEALAGIDIDISLLAKGKNMTTDVSVSGVRLSSLSKLNTRLGALKDVDLTLAGTVSGKITLPETIHSLELNVSSGPGNIAFADLIPDPIKIRAFKLKANADPATSLLEVNQLSLSLGDMSAGGPDLLLSGSVSKHDDLVNVVAETTLKKLKIDDLAVYWPADLISGTRAWLTENLKVGTVDEASMSINMDIAADESKSPALNKLEGKIAYSDLTAFYFRPLPPATGVTGSGSFNQQGFDLSVKSGLVEGITIGPGRVQITGLDVKRAALDVKTSLEGKVQDALAILESPPLRLDKVIGFNSTATGGHITAKFGISLPLKSGLTPKEIKYQVTAELKQASVKNIVGNISLGNGTLKIHDDLKSLSIDGTLDIADIPVELDWDSKRDENGSLTTDINVKANEVKPADINNLGYPVDQYFSESFAVEVDAKAGTGKGIDLTVSAVLDNSGLSIPAIHWNKPPGEKGKASASINISKAKQWSVKDFNVEAGTLSANGVADYAPQGPTLKVDLDSVRLGQTFLRDLSISLEPDQATQISLAGGQLDLTPVLTTHSSQNIAGDKGAVDPSSKKTNEVSTPKPTALKLNIASLDKVLFGQDRFLTDVSAVLDYSNENWQTIQINGQNPVSAKSNILNRSGRSPTQLKPGEFSFSFGPPVAGKYPLTVKVENLGSLAAATFDNHTLTGGELAIEGESSAALFQAPVNASLKLDEFKLVNAPVVAQVLSFGSLKQALNSLHSEGLVIDSLYGDLVLSGNKLSSKLMRAQGGTIGAVIKGEISLDLKHLDLRGSVIPLDKISNLIGKVPLLKHVLVADDGQGIIAIDYSVKGSVENPDVMVKPGSLLTPGALRDVFGVTEKQ
jgi:hypothetical protein